jgi:hypothetical protein
MAHMCSRRSHSCDADRDQCPDAPKVFNPLSRACSICQLHRQGDPGAGYVLEQNRTALGYKYSDLGVRLPGGMMSAFLPKSL